MGAETLDQPLLLSPSCGDGDGPRILDRDGAFAQSRGRWGVASSAAGSPAGSTRQRRGGAPSSAPPAALDEHDPDDDDDAALPSSRRGPRGRGCGCRGASSSPFARRCWDDWFHSVSHTPTCILLLGVLVAYFLTILCFAGLYWTVNRVGERWFMEDAGGDGDNAVMDGPSLDLNLVAADGDVATPSFCGMDINTHMEALYFSLSTMATIGYGTSDYYFGECWTPFLLVLLQVFSAIVFSSLAIGLLFQRMSRGQKRGRTIVFSDVAAVRKVRGRWYVMFRVGELRRRHVIGAKVRAFCVRHERCPVGPPGGAAAPGGPGGAPELETVHFVSRPLPLLDGHAPPSAGAAPTATEGALGQCVLMGLPHVLVHPLSDGSPLVPPRPVWYDARGVPHGAGADPSLPGEAWRDGSEAPTETTATTTEDRQEVAASGGLLAPAAAEEGPPQASSPPDRAPSPEEITRFLRDRRAEIIVFLEGTCETTGTTLQARHSYRAEDLAFDRTFAPCVFPRDEGTAGAGGGKGGWRRRARAAPALEVDFGRFHELVPAPRDAASCPYVPAPAVEDQC